MTSADSSQTTEIVENHSPSLQKPLEATITDSGYSSLSTTPSINSPTLRKNDAYHGPSILSSLRPENGKAKSIDISSIASISLPKKKPALMRVNVDVDKATNERFKIVQPNFETLLLNHVRENQRTGANYKPMSTRLVMLGTSHDDAAPHLVVFCQPGQKRLVKQFVTNRIIKDICQPSDPGVPSFEVTVMGNAPQLKHDISPVRVTVDYILTLPRDTLCGNPIRFTNGCDSSNATFGGIIKVITETGDTKFYGITAGHAVEEWQNELQPKQKITNEHGDDTNTKNDGSQAEIGKIPIDEKDSQKSDSEASDTDDSDIEIGLLTRNVPAKVKPTEEKKHWRFATPLVLGSVVTHASAPVDIEVHNNRCYDWALFETKVYKMNRIPDDLESELTLSDREPGVTGNCPVYMTSGSGFKEGQLSSTPGRILLGSGEEFVDAYMLTIDDERGICDGDSGSWVIDSSTLKVYGHLVASDIFGSGYVIPLKDIFSDIKQRLCAQLVELASFSDLLPIPTMVRSFIPDDSGYNSKKSTPKITPKITPHTSPTRVIYEKNRKKDLESLELGTVMCITNSWR